MYNPDIASAPGTVSQVRDVTLSLMKLAKERSISVFVVGHVTKDGALAGPKVLEHMVDCVLYFEGERHQSHRILRAVKNRFGSTNEIGVFEMTGEGLREVKNPSSMMLEGRPEQTSGSTVICTLEGTRPLLAEVQSLVAPTTFPAPRRMTTGADYNRVNLLIAVLEKRVGLNLLQHMSGVATQTARAVAAVAGTGAKIVDTRKTTPGLRLLDKYAVRVGGGGNHRFNLADGVLIKDNHIVAAGGIAAAVEAARRNAPHSLRVEVEVETLEQLEEALDAGADIIMLDNMPTEKMREAVRAVGGRALTEASGNMGDKTDAELRAVAETGVDLISIGALTHSVRALDVSLKFAWA